MLPYSACIVKHFLPSRLYIFARTLPFPRVLPYNRHMEFKYFKNMLVISGVKPFDLEKCCTCGQAFRWVKNPVHMQAGLFDECGLPDAEASLAFTGVIRGRAVLVMQSDDSLIVTPCAKGEAQLFIDYFDLKRDYSAVEAALAADERLRVCLPGSSGIRVFNQEPFEALISFIISANNNIKRISGIIDRLCSLAGEKLPVRYFSDCAAADCDFGTNSEVFAFPTPERIAALSEDELKQIGAGYRAPYIIKSAKRIADGYDLEKLRSLPTAEAQKELLTFPGVGPKVADCILLFSLGHADAFPVDVWIERAMTELYFSDSSTADVSAARPAPAKSEIQAAARSIGKLSGIVVKNRETGEERELSVSGAFIAVGFAPNNGVFAELVKLDESGFIRSGEDCKTSRPEIFAAGDCRTKSVRQLVTAGADGGVAAIAACEYIDSMQNAEKAAES